MIEWMFELLYLTLEKLAVVLMRWYQDDEGSDWNDPLARDL